MKHSGAILGLMLAFLSVDACGLETTSKAQVSGAVTVGPMCPRVACPDEAVPGVKVAFFRSSEEYDATTDSSGHFALAIPPGDYAIRLTGVNPVLPQLGRIELYPMAGPETVHAHGGERLALRLRIYSGIA